MLTTTILRRVRDNLSRTGIDEKIKEWINDAKREVEQRIYGASIRKSTVLTVTNASPSAPLPPSFRDPLFVKVALDGDEDWSEIPHLSDEEALVVDGVAGTRTGRPEGYTLGEGELKVHPKPESGKTYKVLLGYYEYSPDWQFTATEEPYLAKHAWLPIISLATSLGFAQLGEFGDADRWEQRFLRQFRNFLAVQVEREVEGEFSFRPRTGAVDRRPSRSGLGRP